MTNKLWVIALTFCAFVFGAFAIVAVWMGFLEKKFWEPFAAFIWLCFLTRLTVKLAISRAKYGPNGPPPDPLENFHVDFM